MVAARDDFKMHGIDDLVTVTHRDICKLGFPFLKRNKPAADKSTPSAQNGTRPDGSEKALSVVPF